MINDGNSYEVIGEEDNKWIIKDNNDKVSELDIEKTEESFNVSYQDKSIGSYEILYKYSYLNDEEEIAYDKDVRDGKIDEFAFDYGYEEDYSENSEEIYEDDASVNNQPAVTPKIVSEVDNLETNQEEIAVEEPNVEEAPKNNTPVIIGTLAVVVAAAIGFIAVKKKKEN